MTESGHSIVQRIAEKSEADARAMVETARRVADREVRSAERQARAREERAVAEMDAAAAQAAAGTQARQLQKRHEMVESLLGEALARLASMPRDEKYLGILEQFIRDAVGAMGASEVVIMAARPDRAFLASEGRFARIASVIRSETGTTIRLSEETVAAAGGIVATSADGRVSYQSTFDELSWRRRSELKNLIATELFG
jgi:vacuolar-type H+-ATPase subunit E/Vma4